MVNVMIADDHTLFRQGLCRLLELEHDINVVAVAEHGGQVVRMVQQHKPDVLLLDINMPELNGIEVIKQLQELDIDVRIIVLTIYDDEEYVFEVMKRGAGGYLLKDVEPGFLAHAIRKVARGESVIDSSVATALIGEFSRLSQLQTAVSTVDTGPLTEREYEVLREIANGLSNKEIADKLFISEKTVKNHITSIYRKLDVPDRTTAVVKAVKMGLVEIK